MVAKKKNKKAEKKVKKASGSKDKKIKSKSNKLSKNKKVTKNSKDKKIKASKKTALTNKRNKITAAKKSAKQKATKSVKNKKTNAQKTLKSVKKATIKSPKPSKKTQQTTKKTITSKKQSSTKTKIAKSTNAFTKKQKVKKVVSGVKFTKADAAKKSSASLQKNKSSHTALPASKSEPVEVKKNSPKSLPKEDITIEKVMEATQDTSFLPKSLQSVEKTGFSDNLSDDLSSVYSRTSEEQPEPPGKFTLEYSCKASPELLYKFLTDPIELAEWFCDSVNIRNGIYTFVWNGVPQQARLVKQERNISVKFQWLDKNDGSYFEFNIHKNPLTGDVMLYVTDFSEPEELESNKLWWNTQINKLKTILGLQY